MKRRYKLLIFVIVIEIIILNILKSFGIAIESPTLNILVAFIVLLPVWLLLFYLGKDERKSEKTRLICNGFRWFISICFIGSTIAEIISNLIK